MILTGLTVIPSETQAQTDCELVDSRLVVDLELGTGRASYVSQPRIACADGSRLRADSAAVFRASGFTQLFGQVFFEDQETTLNADRAHFFNQQGRLLAWGRVSLEDRVQGAVITGDTLVLLRANEFRPEDRLTVSGGRPRAIIRPGADPPAAPPEGEPAAGDPAEPPPGPEEMEPYVVDGDRIYLEGSDLFRAGGSVEVTRNDLRALSDSIEYRREGGELSLVSLDAGMASVLGDAFRLDGRRVLLTLPGGRLDGVWAEEDATLAGDGFSLRAPRIRIELDEGSVRRGIATREAPDPTDPGLSPESPGDGPPVRAPRPEALAEDVMLVGDSIDIVAPNQALQSVVAVGSARGEHLGRDDMPMEEGAPELIRRDWMEGDTIRAAFHPPDPDVPEADARLERLVASGSARSLYRLEASRQEDTGDEDLLVIDLEERDGGQADAEIAEFDVEDDLRPAIHYVTGTRIVVLFLDGEVERMEVEGPARGLHLEPGPRPRDTGPPFAGNAGERPR